MIFLRYVLFASTALSAQKSTNVIVDTTIISAFKAKKSYPRPVELVYPGKTNQKGYPGPLYPSIFPIGWSRDGKFAWAEEPPDEACGCYMFIIFIQDMRTDKILWSWRFDMSGEEGYDYNKKNAIYFKQVWQKNSRLFTQKLNQYKIESFTHKKMEKNPLKKNNKKIEFTLTNKDQAEEDYGFQMLNSCTVSLRVDNKFLKNISTIKYTYDIPDGGPKNQSNTLTNKLTGILESPFEKRVAVFVIQERRGWEGPPNVMSFDLVGCDLTKIIE